MCEPIRTFRFKRDVKLAVKRRKDMEKLRQAIALLIEEKSVPQRYDDHPLTGSWKHITVIFSNLNGY